MFYVASTLLLPQSLVAGRGVMPEDMKATHPVSGKADRSIHFRIQTLLVSVPNCHLNRYHPCKRQETQLLKQISGVDTFPVSLNIKEPSIPAEHASQRDPSMCLLPPHQPQGILLRFPEVDRHLRLALLCPVPDPFSGDSRGFAFEGNRLHSVQSQHV